jgi:hypothetical protein
MRLHQQRLIASMRALQRPRGLLVACFVVAYVYLGVGMVTPAFAQRKNPASKLYVAELDGVSDIDIGDRVFELKKGSVHDANNTIIRTRVGASNAIVFSNGTGLHLEPDTALRIEQFVQEPFLPNRTDLDVEPSVSRMSLVLTHGMIGLCTSKLVAGSSMELETPHLMLQIRGKRIVVETNERQTVVSLIEGDVTVQTGDREGGGRTLTAWQRAVVKPILANDSFELVVEDIPEVGAKGAWRTKRLSPAWRDRRCILTREKVRMPRSGPRAAAIVCSIKATMRSSDPSRWCRRSRKYPPLSARRRSSLPEGAERQVNPG